MKRKLEDGDENTKMVKMWKPVNNAIYRIGNEIHFTSGINAESIQQVIKEMTQIINKHEKKNKNKTLEITYVVDSGGGSVTSVLKFVDFINLVKTKYPKCRFTSIVTGMVASAGTIMAIVADERHMTKYSHAMVHELSSGTQNKYTHFMSYSKFLEKLHNCLVDIYMAKTKLEKNEVEEIMNKETWYSAEEYMAKGFVDKII